MKARCLTLRTTDEKNHSTGNAGNARREKDAGGSSRVQARPDRSAGMQHYMMRMQSLVGNRALQRVVAATPPANAPIQRMKDPDGTNRSMLEAMYRGIYERIRKDSGGLIDVPKPSDRSLKLVFAQAITNAKNLNGALGILADHLKDKYFTHLSTGEQNKWREKLITIGKEAGSKAADYEKQKKRDLDALNDNSPEPDPVSEEQNPRKKARINLQGDSDFFKKKKNLELIRKRLANKEFRGRIMSSSDSAHRQIAAMSRKTIPNRAKHNALADEKQPMGIAEMLSAQQNYTQVNTGKALLLEKGTGYQVTMSRRGGQEVNQLGPYLPGSKKKSVQEIVKELIDKKLSTRDLSRAIETRNAGSVRKKYKLTDKKLGKIRALRHLHAIERDRAPEVAISTTMEQRMASHGLSHMTDYVNHHPMGPPQATTDLVQARERAKQKGEQGFSYVPQYIQDRAFGGLDRLAVEAFKKPPVGDPSISLLLREIALAPEKMETNEGEDEGKKDADKEDNLTKAMRLGMMSPPHVWPEDSKHEHEDVYTKLYNELMKIVSGGSKGGDGKNDEEANDGKKKGDEKKGDEKKQGKNPLLGLAHVGAGSDLPVKGLPNQSRATGKKGKSSVSDCFINAVIQLMAEPYADYFDTSKHALKNNAKREVQEKVSDAMKMIKGVNPQDEDGIRKLREKLLASGMVEGMNGHEDASELMLKLLRAVTNLDGIQITIPGQPARLDMIEEGETLADVAIREGCDLGELQTLNVLLDTSPILLTIQSTRTIRKSTNSKVTDPESAVYTGGKITDNPERGPGIEPIDIETFDDFDDYLKYTFGDGSMRTKLTESNTLKVIDDGKAKNVSEYSEQRRMLQIPKVLTFYLKRFKETDYGRAKDDKDFVMPRTFKLVEHSGGGGKEKSFSLTGAVRHSGGTGGGHYTADVSRGDEWYHADDSHVSEKDGADDDIMTQGYIYTYTMTAEKDL